MTTIGGPWLHYHKPGCQQMLISTALLYCTRPVQLNDWAAVLLVHCVQGPHSAWMPAVADINIAGYAGLDKSSGECWGRASGVDGQLQNWLLQTSSQRGCRIGSVASTFPEKGPSDPHSFGTLLKISKSPCKLASILGLRAINSAGQSSTSTDLASQPSSSSWCLAPLIFKAQC